MNKIGLRTGKLTKNRGFSVYDMLVAVGIVTVLGAVAIPALKPVLSNQRMATSVNTLMTALHLTRSTAVQSGKRATLCPTRDGIECLGSSTAWQEGLMVYIDENANRERDPHETVVQLFKIGRAVQLHSPSSRDHVTYQPNGLASGTNTTFVFCDTDRSAAARKVIVANSGRARIFPAREAGSC